MLPLPLRNRLADLLVDAFHDPAARAALEALAAVLADPRALAGPVPERFPADLFEAGADGRRLRARFRRYAEAFASRAGRGAALLAGRAFDPPGADLGVAFGQAGLLWQGGLYFEVHEVLEPHWARAEGHDRDVLQGLIQAAVGFHHLARGNPAGACSLLAEAAGRLGDVHWRGVALEGFARDLASAAAQVAAAPGAGDTGCRCDRVPPFPFGPSRRAAAGVEAAAGTADLPEVPRARLRAQGAGRTR
jgi:hypothetical protein